MSLQDRLPLAVVCGAGDAVTAACADVLGAFATVVHRPLADGTEESLGSSPEELGEALKLLEAAHGPLQSVAVVLPQPSLSGLPEQITAQEWRQQVDTLLTRTFVLVQAAGRIMIGHGSGSIAIVSTLDALGGAIGRTAVCAASAGVHGFVEAAAIEWARHGVRINLVATPPQPRTDAERAMLADRTPSARETGPDEIANAVGYALASTASQVNGTVLTVDGGLSSGLITRWNGADLASNALLERGLYTAR